MTSAERERFHNLLLMAKESPFEGERRNALEAAQRMAERHGMTLEEAARTGGEAMQQPGGEQARECPQRRPKSGFDRAAAEAAARERVFAEMSQFVRDMETHTRADKARYEEALREAYARGLDAEERKAAERRKNRDRVPRRNSRRRNPEVHARVLLKETRLPLREIASICGLDVWTVAGLKLKMREEAVRV